MNRKFPIHPFPTDSNVNQENVKLLEILSIEIGPLYTSIYTSTMMP